MKSNAPLLIMGAVLALCCATPGSRSRKDPFPKRAEIDAIAESPAAQNPFLMQRIDVDRWEFASPAATRIELTPHVDSSVWGVLLQGAIAGSSAVPTSAMHCAAHEIGRFHLEKGGLPSQPLTQYMLARCGTVGADAVPRMLFGESLASHSDDQIFAAWQDSVVGMIRAGLGRGSREVGLWFGRREDRAVVIMVAAELRADVEPFEPVVYGSGHLSMQGRLRFEAERVHALINQGHYGFTECRSNPDLELPDFEVVCPMHTGDEIARVEVSAIPSGRILGKHVFNTLARRPSVSLEYQRFLYGESKEIDDVSDFAPRVTAMTNRVRGRAGLAPVRHADAQTKTATSVAPHFFQSHDEEGFQASADVIILGLIAGWDVEDLVRHGYFTAGSVAPSQDAGHWLNSILESPSGRSVLLDPEIRRVAFGPILTEDPSVLGSIVLGYALFDEGNADSLVERVYQKIERERTRRGLSPPLRIHAFEDDAREYAMRVQAGHETPMEALESMMQRGVDVLHRPVQGFYLETNDLDAWTPDKALFKRRLELAVAVAYYQPEGVAWGRYVVLVLTAAARPMAALDVDGP